MKLYNTKQAGEYLGISGAMIRHWIRKGKLKAQLVNREYILTERSLKAFKK